MITFLPFENFSETAACLDRQRLGKQRVETLMIARCIAGVPSSWKNHPAVKMWRQNPQGLLLYQRAIVYEWTGRGYSDNCLDETEELLHAIGHWEEEPPWWLGDEAFHAAHRGNLLRKDPKHYGKFFADADIDLAYRWPTAEFGVWRGGENEDQALPS